MINRNNIVDFISFLYQKKFNRVAPQELLDSWSGLNDNETVIHLNGLYRHWNLDTITSRNFEQEFFSRDISSASGPIMPVAPQMSQAPPQQTQYAPPPPPQQQQFSAPNQVNNSKSSGKGILYFLLVFAVLGALGFYIWTIYEKDTNAPPEVTATNNAAIKVDTPETVATPIVAAAPKETEDDKINARVIQDLMYAENNRNFEEIYSAFDPNMERYWDINYPVYDELKARYERTWSQVVDNDNSNIKVQKVADKTYDVSLSYSYFSLKDQKQKKVESKVRFVFNEEHKIIKTYGL